MCGQLRGVGWATRVLFHIIHRRLCTLVAALPVAAVAAGWWPGDRRLRSAAGGGHEPQCHEVWLSYGFEEAATDPVALTSCTLACILRRPLWWKFSLDVT